MKNWMNRFALLAVLGAVIGSAVVVGCGGPAEEETPAANNANAAGGAGAETETD